MKPIEICKHLGPARIDAYYEELSAQELRAVLKAGGSHSNTPATAYTQSARRKVWRQRFDAEFRNENDQLALAFLIEWLMRHHRSMLVDYLNTLGIKHVNGETEEDFCETRMPDVLREAIKPLLAKYPKQDVAAYLLLVGHLQETPIFDQTPMVLEALGLSSADAAAYVSQHEKTWKKPVRN